MKNIGYKIVAVLVAIFCVAVFSGIYATPVQAKDADGNYVVVIDPGHGGNDPGAVSPFTGDTEDELNWSIATALKAELETYAGVKVYLTRGSAEYQSNTGRASTARELGADLSVGIHINSSEIEKANGIVCYGTVNATHKAAVKSLSNKIASKVSALGISKFNGGYVATKSTYSDDIDFYTFIDENVCAGIPALIIEHCYVSNESDSAFINKKENQEKVGIADATAIAEHLGLKKRGVSAGTCIELTRTYSAYMITTKEGTYSVSDSSVLNVREDGLITALKSGIATVTCTAADGTVETVKVVVPEVKPVKLVAGSIQSTFTSFEKAKQYDKSRLMVKVVYSDGTVTQLSSGYTLGEPVEGTAVDQGNGHIKTPVDVAVTYGDMSCTLNMYHYTKLGTSTGSSMNNYQVVGTNKDVLVIPANHAGIADAAVVEVDASVVIDDPEPETEEETEESDNSSEGGFSFKFDSEKMWVYVACAALVVVIIVCIAVIIIMSRNMRRRR